VYKLQRFDGGINNHANARDISDNEVVSIKNGSVDTLGSVKALQYTGATSSTFDGGSITSKTGARATIEENKIPFGKGLFLFSSDFTGGELLTLGTHTASSNVVLKDSNNRFIDDVVNGATIWNLTQDISATITDTSDASNAGNITGATGSAWATNDKYRILNLHNATAISGVAPGRSTGESYVCIPKQDGSTGGIYLKAQSNGNAAQAVIKFTTNSAIEPSYYSADGNLRVSDSKFNVTYNKNKWYGYINRELFSDTNYPQITNTWVSEDSEPKKVTSYQFQIGGAVSIAATSTTFGTNADVSATNNDTNYTSNSNAVSSDDANVEKTQAQLAANSGMGQNFVHRVAVRIATTGFSLGQNWTITGVFRIGRKNGTSFNATAYKYKTFTLENNKLGGDEGAGAITHVILNFNWAAEEFAINVDDVKYSLRELTKTSNAGAGTLTIDSITFYNDGATTDEVYSTVANSIGVAVGDSLTESSDWSGDWNVGATFVYDGNQESLVQQLLSGTEDVVTLTKAPYVNVSVAYTKSWNQRITGVNIYMKKESDSEWLLHALIDFKSSTIHRPLDSVKQSSAYNTSNSAHLYKLTGEINKDIPIITYESNSGISQESPSLTAEFKTATVANRRAYIGNVRMLDNTGEERVFADRIIKSPVNQFDTFPIQNVVDAVVNDGESITALMSFGDKLLQFKNRNLYILNIAGRYEVLESTHKYRGAESKEAVCMTEFGVAWCNKYGVFFYNGRSIDNLLEKKGLRTISEDDWNAFYTEHGAEDGSVICYVPKKRQLIVISSYGDTADSGNAYIYDFVTQSWSFADNLFGTDSTEISNIINSWDGDLFYLENTSSNVKLQNVTVADKSSSAFELITKEIDFGNPASKKNIYKIIVTYKGGTSQNIVATYGVDGGALTGALTGTMNSEANIITNGNFDSDTTGWNADGTATLSVNGSNQLVITSGGSSNAKAIYTLTTVAGATYNVSGNFIKGTADQGLVQVGTSGSIGSGVLGSQSAMTSNTEFSFTFTATGTTSYIILYEGSGVQDNGDTTIWDNIAVSPQVPSQAVLELTPSSIISNAKSFQLKLAGTSASTFELNDIGIVYREKRVV
tara:strand:- start:8450 stop:11740 length:3291 start_codon:yes stop_codon:yes gene_type:complete